MPSELRRIAFSNGEVVEAIDRLRKSASSVVPPGRIASCRPRGGEPFAVRIVVHHVSDGSVRTLDLDRETVAAALLRFCFDHKIPIPRAAIKTVQAEGDGGVALVLSSAARGTPGPKPGPD